MQGIGQLTMIGVEGKRMSSELQLFLQEMEPGGVIIFSRNVASPKQLKRFIGELQGACEYPLMVGVDQEGGRVMRLREPFTELPPMASIRKSVQDASQMAASVGSILARELRAVGINLDFAPVMDVATNATNPIIGDRAFGSDPEEVALLGADVIRAMQGEGVGACAKHFPGHGDTEWDSHLGLPVLPLTRRRFELCELIPFRAAVEADVASIMTSHLLIPNLDPECPVTISREITTELLRNELRYDGLVITDDLIMRGIADDFPPAESAWRAIAAGADIALICHDKEAQRAALAGLRLAVEDGRISRERVERSFARIQAFRERFCVPLMEEPPLSIIGCRNHRKIAKQLRQA